MKNKLVILDLKKNYNLSIKDSDILFLSHGKTITENCKTIYIKEIFKNKKNFCKSKVFTALSKYLNSFDKLQKNFKSLELDISNLRNDKTIVYDKIINLILIKKILIKKYRNIEIIYDDNNMDKAFKSIKKNNIFFKNISNKKKIKKSLISFLYKRFAFVVRAIFIVIFSKIFLKNPSQVSKSLNLNIYPLFSKNSLFLNKNYTKLNFLITNETHISENLLSKIKLINKMRNQENMIFVEKNIFFSDLIKNFILTFYYFKIINFYKKKQIIIENLNFSDLIYEQFFNSLINRIKLAIYNNSIIRIFKKYNINKFNYFLFEYSFGFYLYSLINSHCKNINFTGYQHGIFSKNLMWLDFIKFKSKQNFYLPRNVVATNKFSKKDYRYFLNKKNFKIILNNNFYNILKPVSLKDNKDNKKILVILGQHDVKDLIYFFSNSKKYNKNQIYYKFHPRTKKKYYKRKSLITVDEIKDNFYSKIFISQTSTLIYQFQKSKIKFYMAQLDYKYNIVNDYFRKNLLK